MRATVAETNFFEGVGVLYKVSRRINVALLAAIAFGAFGAFADDQGSDLPTEDCVRLQREARIARLRHDPATELEKLEAAHRDCPGVITPIYALVKYYRQHPGLEDKYQQFVSLLTQRIQDPESVLPVGIIQYLIRDREVGDLELRALLDRVSRQSSKPAEQDPGWLRIRAQLEQRLGETEAAVITLEQLAEQQDADDVFVPLLMLYSKLERWQEAAELIAPRVDKDQYLRRQYIYVLGKLGRYDEVLKQVHLLTMGASTASATGALPKLESILAALDIEHGLW